MASILIVCTGNICRSPVAAALLQDRLNKQGLTDWQVTSVGTWALEKRGASQYSVEIMAEQGLDITEHQATMIEYDHLKKSDLVLCMESGQMEALQVEFPTQAKKIHLLSEMIDRNYSISDPYGRAKDAYYRMVGDVTGIIENGLDRIIELAEVQASQT
ncbi:MAG: low molecular weight phosphotyrosine protein phosphatase [Anaerolineae bacterium]|nr:low molecular weight phosphotyrosine protein phosphatase [Anaerolineae bacterium]